MSEDSTRSSQNTIIQINEEQIKDHLGEMVRGTVEETLNEMLEQEAEQNYHTGWTVGDENNCYYNINLGAKTF